MRDAVEDWPVALTYAVLVVVALARSNATYWAGRGLRAGGSRTRWSSHLDRPAVVRAEGVVARYGAVAVTLSFLTVGVQTAVNAAAGALRMPLRRYLPGSVVGSLLWAALYTTVGLAVVRAALGRLPWWWVLGAVALAVVLAWGADRALRARRP